MNTMNWPEVWISVISRMVTMRPLRAMTPKLASDNGRPFRPDGRLTYTSSAPSTEAAPSMAKAARQPKCVATKVTSGRPPAIANDQPRNTTAMALERCFSGTMSATVAAACGVKIAAAASINSRNASTAA